MSGTIVERERPAPTRESIRGMRNVCRLRLNSEMQILRELIEEKRAHIPMHGAMKRLERIFKFGVYVGRIQSKCKHPEMPRDPDGLAVGEVPTCPDCGYAAGNPSPASLNAPFTTAG